MHKTNKQSTSSKAKKNSDTNTNYDLPGYVNTSILDELESDN